MLCHLLSSSCFLPSLHANLVTLQISDTGANLGSADVTSLYHALEAGNLPNTSRAQRIALFLPICSGIAEAMAGTLTVHQSRTELKFSVSLPFDMPL